MDSPNIPVGFCQCGCGGQTGVAKKDFPKRGYVAGQHYEYIRGHRRAKHNFPGAAEYVVEDRGYITPCWIWQRSISRETGYGLVDGKGAHRIAYEDAKGSIPKGMHLDHLCRVRACVNPAHLEVVTSAENTRRGSLTKLSSEQVRQIREKRKNGAKLAELVVEFGVVQSRISRICSRHAWREQNDPKAPEGADFRRKR